MVLNFGKKGFWGVYERRGDFFWSGKGGGDFFKVLYFLTAKINNNISSIYYWQGIFGYAKNVGIFLGRQILKLEYFGV